MMCDADVIAGRGVNNCASKTLKEKTLEIGDRATLMSEDEIYYNNGAQSSEVAQGGAPEEVEEHSESHNYQEMIATDNQGSSVVTEGETKYQQKAPNDATMGLQDLPTGSYTRTPDKERRVYVGNLSYQVTWKDLKDYMRKCGNVVYADVLTEYNGMSKGCGVVKYSTKEEAQRAISELNDTQLLGRSIFVREDREEESKFGAMHSRRGRYSRYAGARGVYPYSHDGRYNYMHKGSVPGDHTWNQRGAGGFQSGYNNFYRRSYYDGHPYGRGEDNSRYGMFNNYRDIGFKQRSGPFHQRRNFYGPVYDHQGGYGGRADNHNSQNYYYGYRGYNEDRGAQSFSGHRNVSPKPYYRNFVGPPYPSGSELNTNNTGGAYVNRDTANIVHNYNNRGGYSADYNGQSNVCRYTDNQYI